MDQNLNQVNTRIGPAILAFYEYRMDTGNPTFHAEELHSYVNRVTGSSAPGSADRILRAKKQKGELNYTLLDRRRSLYRFEEILETPNTSFDPSINPTVGA